ncbi:hypothetical protein A6F68_00364 [Tsuneonella dongtanensis]|uniref:DUF1223 domain-containing protein n=1 Tax=Tsuneonella dongtanensis TaxID=692370 RepID=A0A1B2A9S0_9SPHN|nr:DUF1223 domain-containing protein [Tsuneonella dongtanensis]ANY18899.1 hypothetical protein A6F68_00364 [Tsuneonella dongtanensis]
MANLLQTSRRILATGSLGLAAIAVVALLGPASQARSARDASSNPVVVELFTSQGCSSCPPADAFAARLARESDVLMITRPITYWDRLGWKDTLARPANTDLQRAYARRGFDRNGVYTPQMVIAGRRAAVGSNEGAVRVHVSKESLRERPSLSVSGSAISIAGPGKGGELMLLTLRPSVTVGIGSGENGGLRVTYTNVVEGEQRIGSWSGGPARFSIPAETLAAKGKRHAVILREPDGGPVLAGRAL